MIAGLRRLATSLWLHFVASPQRVPGIGHRRRGSPVVNVIDRVPPHRDRLQHRRYPAATTREGIRRRDTEPANADAHDYCPTASVDPPYHLRVQTTPSRKDFQASASRARARQQYLRRVTICTAHSKASSFCAMSRSSATLATDAVLPYWQNAEGGSPRTLGALPMRFSPLPLPSAGSYGSTLATNHDWASVAPLPACRWEWWRRS
jgi:hypothetical protein